MLLYQGDKEEHDGHNNGQVFLIEKQFNLTELKKSKSDNVVAEVNWKTDDPSEYNFLISDISIYRKPITSKKKYITLYL